MNHELITRHLLSDSNETEYNQCYKVECSCGWKDPGYVVSRASESASAIAPIFAEHLEQVSHELIIKRLAISPEEDLHQYYRVCCSCGWAQKGYVASAHNDFENSIQEVFSSHLSPDDVCV